MKTVVLITSALMLMTSPVFSQPENLKVIQKKTAARIKEIAAKSRGALGVAVVDLTTGERFGLNEHLVFPQASAIKIAILMEVFKQAEEGKFKLTDARRIQKQDKTGGSGVLVELGDGSVEMCIGDLCVLMIVLSDNTATNLLIDLVGKENINRTLASLGFKETKVQRRMMDVAASYLSQAGRASRREAARLMALLFKAEFVRRKACDDMLAILKKSKSTNLKAGLPEDVTIASKPGGIAGVATEWAIVYVKERPYAIAVMENYGLGDAPEAMKEISGTVHDYFSRLGRATAHGALVDKPK